MRFFFCKATTTLCVNSRKNQRGAAEQNRLNKQNGAGRLFTRKGWRALPIGEWSGKTATMTAAEKRSLLKKAELFLNGEQFRPFFAKKQRRGPFAS